MKLIIVGSRGRMGQALLACGKLDADCTVVGQVDLEDDLGALLHRADVVIEFSAATATVSTAGLCAQHGKALVIGTTGHGPSERAAITHHAKVIPIVWSANYSMGVNTLFWLTRKAAEILGPGFDLEVVEMHHRMKKDAPSGTAATLARILAEVRREEANDVMRHGRQGLTGERSGSEIGVHAIRGGDVVGDHTVIFAASGERLELTHRAGTRDTFANGALRAAHWVLSKPPGLYDMQDVLGLK